MACQEGHTEAAILLLSHGADVDKARTSVSIFSWPYIYDVI